MILKGINTASDIIGSTMGSKGNLVLINKGNKLRFTKDGVSVAREIKLEDTTENIGAQILISAANETVGQCGDGTTATSILVKAFINEYFNKIKSLKDINSYLKFLDSEVNNAVNNILKQSKEVTDIATIKKIATISSNSERIGNLFEDIYNDVGLNSLIYLQRPPNNPQTFYEVSKGVEYDTGYVNSSFINNKVDKTVVFENPSFYISKDPITSASSEISRVMGIALNNEIPLVIIAPRFSDSFIRQVSMNKTAQGLQICLIKTPGFGNGINKNVEDINAYLSKDGTVDKIIVTSKSFTLFNENNDNNLEEYIGQLHSLSKTSEELYDMQDYKRRAHKLNKSTATIFCGGNTQEESSEEYDRLEDALGAVRTSINQGYVVGGGLALIKATRGQELEEIGKYPHKQILNNANINIIKDFMPDNNTSFSLDNEKMIDYLENGIIDPTGVVIQSLLNAYSCFKLLFNTSFIINSNAEELFKESNI